MKSEESLLYYEKLRVEPRNIWKHRLKQAWCPVLCGCTLLILCIICLILVVLAYQYQPAQSEYNFIIIGDWGLDTPEQARVAYLMNSTARSEAVHGIISTGDHFYWDGVESITDPLWHRIYGKDFMFHNSLESVYNVERPLRDIPWYLTLGNHDWHKNPYAQIDYNYLNHHSV